MPILPPWFFWWRASDDASVTLQNTRPDGQRGIVLDDGASEGSVTGSFTMSGWTQAIPSWQADAPSGTSILVQLRGELDGRWTNWYELGEWSLDAQQRHSIDGQADGDGAVATDTLILNQPAQTLEWRVVLRGTGNQSPALRVFAASLGPAPETPALRTNIEAVEALPVPQWSQMAYPGGGPVWCSPTALTMLLAYWHDRTNEPQLAPFADAGSVPELVAPAVYDPVYDGTGNWPFNTAFAATLGLEGYVLQLGNLHDLAEWLEAGVPVVASIRFERGELDNTPQEFVRSGGHLVVVVGVTADGDLIVNDPRADSRIGENVQRVYRRDEFHAAWNGSGRTVYLLYPPDWVREINTVT